MFTITRKLEFDAGHRIPNHKSQCRHLHGHRYVMEVTITGDLIDKEGDSSEGMVMDFGDIKEIMMKEVVHKWDHAFLAWKEDKEVLVFLNTIPNHKTVLIDHPPTSECLAQEAFNILSQAFSKAYGKNLQLERVRLYETPNCWADVTG